MFWTIVGALLFVFIGLPVIVGVCMSLPASFWKWSAITVAALFALVLGASVLT